MLQEISPHGSIDERIMQKRTYGVFLVVLKLWVWNDHNSNCAKNTDRLYALDLLFNITK